MFQHLIQFNRLELMYLCVSGWRPKRTLIFASWDAEEFGLLGSTEWAEVRGVWGRATMHVCVLLIK